MSSTTVAPLPARFARLVKFEHSLLALPFAHVGAVIAGDLSPSARSPQRKTLAMDPSPLLRVAINRLAAWAHLTGSDCVVRYLAASGHKVVIDIPHGHTADAADMQGLQTTLNSAVGALLDFHAGRLDRDACIAAITGGLEVLAWHRENVRKNDQPELELN